MTARQLERIPVEYQEYIRKAANKTGFPYQNVIAAILLTESNANMLVRGSSGEIGLMQIMPSTFQMLKKKYNLKETESDLYDPEFNIYVGTLLLKDNYKFLGSLEKTIKAYNVGVDLKPEYAANYYYQKVLKNMV